MPRATDPRERRAGQAVPEFLQTLWTEAQQAIGRTERQVNELVTGLAASGKVTREEAAHAFRDTLKALRRNRAAIVRHWDRRLAALSRMVHVPTRTEVDSLRRRVAVLRERIDRLTNGLGGSSL
jgi:polyhydroxyalkanoate synthesis regulator phasin